jgi:hypothetical protein
MSYQSHMSYSMKNLTYMLLVLRFPPIRNICSQYSSWSWLQLLLHISFFFESMQFVLGAKCANFVSMRTNLCSTCSNFCSKCIHFYSRRTIYFPSIEIFICSIRTSFHPSRTISLVGITIFAVCRAIINAVRTILAVQFSWTISVE